MFFVGDDLEHGRELWSSDGTAAGTRMVLDLLPGAEGSVPSDLVVLEDRLLFAADDGVHGRELWVSDGTAAGTHPLELRPGVRGADPQGLRAIGSVVVFSADDGVHGLEPWVSDGTPGGTHLLADVEPGPLPSSAREFTAYGPWLLFNAGRPETGYELYRLPVTALATSSADLGGSDR